MLIYNLSYDFVKVLRVSRSRGQWEAAAGLSWGTERWLWAWKNGVFSISIRLQNSALSTLLHTSFFAAGVEWLYLCQTHLTFIALIKHLFWSHGLLVSNTMSWSRNRRVWFAVWLYSWFLPPSHSFSVYSLLNKSTKKTKNPHEIW